MIKRRPDDSGKSREILDRLAGKGDPNHRPESVLARIMGLTAAREPPPDDMPAMEKIKVYARSGYDLHHIGTDEDFERVWAEAFPNPEEVTPGRNFRQVFLHQTVR